MSDNLPFLTDDDMAALDALMTVEPPGPSLAFVTFARTLGKDLSKDYVGADLRGYPLAGQDLSQVNLEGADLRGADLSGAWGYDAKGARLDYGATNNLPDHEEYIFHDQKEWESFSPQAKTFTLKFYDDVNDISGVTKYNNIIAITVWHTCKIKFLKRYYLQRVRAIWKCMEVLIRKLNL